MESFIHLDAGFYLHILPNHTAVVQAEHEIVIEDWAACTLIHERQWPPELAGLVREYARPAHSRVWDIPDHELDLIGLDWAEMAPNERSNRAIRIRLRARQHANVYIRRRSLTVRRGDIVRIIRSAGAWTESYRLIFDGQQVVEMENNLMRGWLNIIPREFPVVTEFPIRYWEGPHVYVPFPHSAFLPLLLDTMRIGFLKTESRPYLWCSFVHRDQLYYVLFLYGGTILDSIQEFKDSRQWSHHDLAPKVMQLFREELQNWRDFELLFEAGFSTAETTFMMQQEVARAADHPKITEHNTLVFHPTNWFESRIEKEAEKYVKST